MKTLVAGPWCGEWGWEIMSWQGRVRKLALDGTYDKVMVCCPSRSRHLYADFARQFLDSDDVDGKPDCWWTHAPFQAELARLEARLAEFPDAVRVRPSQRWSLEDQRFIRYGNQEECPSVLRRLLVLHARGPVGRHPERMWPSAKWDELAERLTDDGHRLLAVGTAAQCPPAAMDGRSMPLHEVCNVLACARLALGPSSGPMHLASLCGTPHLPWTDKRKWSAIGNVDNRCRYETLWNPFGTSCRVLDGFGWDPPVVEVRNAVAEFLRRLDAGDVRDVRTAR
jgi:hypothetical protein